MIRAGRYPALDASSRNGIRKNEVNFPVQLGRGENIGKNQTEGEKDECCRL
jgi:hypothetical protein